MALASGDKVIEQIKSTSKRSRSGEKSFGGRLIIDVRNREVIPIPRDIDHHEFIAEYLDTTLQELANDPKPLSNFVGAWIKMDETGHVTNVLVGVTGLETYFGEKSDAERIHSKEETNKAMDILMEKLATHPALNIENVQTRIEYL